MNIAATHKKLGIDYRKKSGQPFVIYLIGNDEGLYKEIAPGKWRFVDLPDRTNEYMKNKCYELLIQEFIKDWNVAKIIGNRDLLKNENKKELYFQLLNKTN